MEEIKKKTKPTKATEKKTSINYRDVLPIPIVNTKIFIHSIPRKNVLGMDRWTNDSSGTRLKKNKIGDRATDKLSALYSHKRGQLLNGLTYKPWMHEGLAVVDDNNRALSLQDKLEMKWDLPKGYLTSRPYRRDDPVNRGYTFFQTETWALRDGSTILDLGTMKGDVGYHMMLDSKYVANSEKERMKWPKATHFISITNESEEIKYRKTSLKTKAFAALTNEIMTVVNKRRFVHILELASTRTTLTEEQIHNLLFDYIDKSGYMPNSNIDKFLHLYELLKQPDGNIQIGAHYLLRDTLDHRVIYEKQGAYNWPRPKGLIVIGETKAEAIEFLTNPKKETLVEELEYELKAKKID